MTVQAVVLCIPALVQQQWTTAGPGKPSEFLHHLLSFNHNFSNKTQIPTLVRTSPPKVTFSFGNLGYSEFSLPFKVNS